MLKTRSNFFIFGGFNCIRFKSDVDYTLEGLVMIKKLTLLSNSSILIWTGITREGQILEKEKIKKSKNKLITRNQNIQSITEKAYEEFSKPNWTFKKIGKFMNDYWHQKKQLSKGITNKKIDRNLVKLQI